MNSLAATDIAPDALALRQAQGEGFGTTAPATALMVSLSNHEIAGDDPHRVRRAAQLGGCAKQAHPVWRRALAP